ncbi:formylglycine-generating enzyme family protein [bacterium]|nr:formylglycine-generating enzyme family protein [bacterium]
MEQWIDHQHQKMKFCPVVVVFCAGCFLISSLSGQDSLKSYVNPWGMEFVFIPAGTFMMGTPDPDCPPDDPATPANETEICLDAVNVDERPYHQVRISTPFYMGKYEVMQSEWRNIMESNPSGFVEPEGGKDTGRRPVEQVSWDDIQAFVRKLSEMDPQSVYRLPTEAEWEYACKAGTTGPFYGRPRDALMWYDRNSGHVTHEVGQAKANAWGLHDMLGNVWEWCGDWYGLSYYAQSPSEDPRGSEKGERRVIRGGGIYDWSNQSCATFRCSGPPDDRCNTVGFRLVRLENK